jgi:hypothetical protein
MHIERNVSNIVFKYLFSECDTLHVHKDMEEVGVKQHLWFHQDPQSVNYVKPPTPYVFTQAERQSFLDFFCEVCALTTYVVAFKKMVDPNGLYNMKSHDHHVMLQHILPCDIHNLLHLGCKKGLHLIWKGILEDMDKGTKPN